MWQSSATACSSDRSAWPRQERKKLVFHVKSLTWGLLCLGTARQSSSQSRKLESALLRTKRRSLVVLALSSQPLSRKKPSTSWKLPCPESVAMTHPSHLSLSLFTFQTIAKSSRQLRKQSTTEQIYFAQLTSHLNERCCVCLSVSTDKKQKCLSSWDS